MNSSPRPANEGLFSSAERWSPADAELFERWRAALTDEQREDALLPLQAVLSGLVAFRDLENQALSDPVTDFHPQLLAVRVAYGWAMQLARRLRGDGVTQSALIGLTVGEPECSLRALERSLRDALRVNEQLAELAHVDAEAFQASCDLFVRELRCNRFFQPPEPLELSSAAELVGTAALPPELESWEGDGAKSASMICFLTLLRDHRFLGIADRQLRAHEGIYCAHVVVAAVRRELAALSRFLLVQEVETFADELGKRLLSVEAIAISIHAKARSVLNDPLPELGAEGLDALAAERMHDGLLGLRATVKEAAKQLHGISRPAWSERPERKSERVQRNLHQDIWAFRFILQAFIAKASAALLTPDRSGDEADLAFTGEFLRHFRVLGLRLSRGTEYERRGPLTRAVSALRDRDAIDDATLGLATDECTLFLEHLDAALAEGAPSPLVPFDKTKAAAELRGYLSAIKTGRL